jgi:hypothetical protein
VSVEDIDDTTGIVFGKEEEEEEEAAADDVVVVCDASIFASIDDGKRGNKASRIAAGSVFHLHTSRVKADSDVLQEGHLTDPRRENSSE